MRIYYHNITQDYVNCSDLEDFLSIYKEGDKCYKSEAGNACIAQLSKDDIKALEWQFQAQQEDQTEDDYEGRAFEHWQEYYATQITFARFLEEYTECCKYGEWTKK